MAIGLLKSDTPEHFLTQFFVLAFADLKKYKFFYLFAIPAIATEPKWLVEPVSGSSLLWSNAASSLGLDTVRGVADILPAFVAAQSDGAGGAFLLRSETDQTVQLARVSEFDQFFSNVPEENVRLPCFPETSFYSDRDHLYRWKADTYLPPSAHCGFH